MSEGRAADGFDGASVAALCLFLLLFCALCFYVWGYTVDDAFIVERYARRLLRGDGYTFTSGPVTDGVTGPLWLVPSILGTALGVGLAPAKWLSTLGIVLAVGLCFLRLQTRRARMFFLAFCAVQGNLVVWAVAGLETGLATALTSYLVLCASPRRPPDRIFTKTVFLSCAVLLCTLRPESLPFATLACALFARTHSWLRILRWASVPVCGFLALCALRMALFGHPLALSYYAKSGSIDLIYVAFGLAITTGAVPLIVTWWCGKKQSQHELLAGLTLAATWALSVAWAGGDWMPGFRLLVPIVPTLGWLLARAFSGVGVSLRALIAVCLLVPAVDSLVQLPRAVEAGARQHTHGSALLHAIEAQAKGGTVALVDIGLVGARTNLEVLDLGGVTDPRVGRAPGGYLAKQVDIGLIESAEPSLIVLHSFRPIELGDPASWPPLVGYPIENWLYTQPWVRTHYQPTQVIHYAPSYDYLLLARLSAADAKISASAP